MTASTIGRKRQSKGSLLFLRAVVRRKGLLNHLSAEQTREKGVPVLQAGFLTLEKLSNIQ
jgi:hypothetical protein